MARRWPTKIIKAKTWRSKWLDHIYISEEIGYGVYGAGIETGHTFYESWGYKIKNEYYPDLRIEFEDGRLEGLSQD